jgi:hypothetical protein
MEFDPSPLGLAGLFDQFGAELAAAQEPHDIFALLTAGAVRHVSGSEQAGVTQSHNGSYKTIAPTDDLVRKVDQIQYDLKSGPCVDAIVDNTIFCARDLREDERWPEFGQRAFDTVGVVSMLSFRLFFEDSDVVAALNLYSTQPDAFDDTAQSVGLLLSTHGALALSAAIANEKADNLLQALRRSREIGVAMGVLMSRYKVTEDQAFGLLRIASQQTHRKVASIALEVAETGELPPAATGAAAADPTSEGGQDAGEQRLEER